MTSKRENLERSDMEPTAPPPRPKRRWRVYVIEALIVLALIFAVRAYQQRDAVRGPAPALAAFKLDGQWFDLAAKREQPILVHFWASWCPICRAQEGAIAALARKQPIITVAMQSGDAREVAAYLKKEGFDVPVIVDPDGDIARRFGVRGTPTDFIVDTDGQIRFVEVGYTSEWGLHARLWWAGY